MSLLLDSGNETEKATSWWGLLVWWRLPMVEGLGTTRGGTTLFGEWVKGSLVANQKGMTDEELAPI